MPVAETTSRAVRLNRLTSPHHPPSTFVAHQPLLWQMSPRLFADKRRPADRDRRFAGTQSS